MDGSEQQAGGACCTTLRSEIVVEVPNLRVVEWTLGEGESLPWHRHTQVDNIFYCLQGLIGIDTRQSGQDQAICPGERCVVPAKIIHRVRNIGNGIGRFLLIEGIGYYDHILVE